MTRAALLSLALAGCFSGDDFSDCESDEQCGRARVCVNNECVFLEGSSADGGSRVDSEGGGLETVVVQSLTDLDQDTDGKRVILDGLTVPRGERVFVSGAVVEIRGPVNADGAGGQGGGGGGGGAGGHEAHRAEPGGGGRGVEGSGSGEGGRDTTTTVGGRGGEGGRGGGDGADQGGGTPGDGGTFENREGEPGGNGRFEPRCTESIEVRTGIGGGGGGGGAGGKGTEACGAGGGGGGGAGGAGGGFIAIRADDRIVVAATLSARGKRGQADGGNDGGAGCPCGGPCEAEHGTGGDGGDATDPPEGPGMGAGTGDAGGGVGGSGGAGSGGLVHLTAPTIEFLPGGSIDVSGGAASNGGQVSLYGEVSGSPTVIGVGAGGQCPPGSASGG